MDPLQLLLQHLLGGGDELQRSDELGGGEQQLHGGLRLMHRRHQLQLVVQLHAVVAGEGGTEGPQRPLAHDPVDGGGPAPQDGHGPLRLLQPVLQLVLRGHGVEKRLGAKRDLPGDAHLHHVQVVTQLDGDKQLINICTSHTHTHTRCEDECVHLLLQQLGGRHVSAALPSGAVEVRPGQDAVEGRRVLQSKLRLHEDLQSQNTDEQDGVRSSAVTPGTMHTSY